MESEQGVRVRRFLCANEPAVQREDTGVSDVDTRSSEYPKLHGSVQQEDLLDSRGGFHFHQPPTTFRQPFEHIGPHGNTLVLKCCFEQRRHPVVADQAPSLVDRLVEVPVILRDQLTIGIARARELPDFVTGVEDELRDLVDDWREIPLAGVEPEAEVTLRSVDESGLGEAGGCGASGHLGTRELR